MNWKKIDHWAISDENNTSLMIVENESGRRILLACLKPNAVECAQWLEAVEVLPSDTREALEKDAGRVCQMSVWQCAIAGHDEERKVLDWEPIVCHRIATGAKEVQP